MLGMVDRTPLGQVALEIKRWNLRTSWEVRVHYEDSEEIEDLWVRFEADSHDRESFGASN